MRRKDGAVNGGQHRQQQYQCQGEPETVFERLAHCRQIAVLRIRALHSLGERGELRRHGIDGHDIATFRAGAGAARRGIGDGRRRPDEVFSTRIRIIETHVRPQLADLSDEIRRGPRRQRLEGIFQARRDNALMLPEENDLQRLRGMPLVIEPRLDILRRGLGEQAGQRLRSLGILTHAQVECRAGQHERVTQPLLHLDLEPAVDTPVQEFE